MAKKSRRSRGRSDRPAPERGPKTHRADVLGSRGEPEEPDPERDASAGDEVESRRERELADERPTRTKATGHQPDVRNR